jgi:adenosylcobyric acid synthase
LRIAVVALPHLSNFTDFDPLAAEPGVSLAYVDRREELEYADLAIVPGSKQTMDDLDWLRKRGLDCALREMRSRGHILMGVCGGFQMMGTRIDDPHGVERAGSASSCEGMGLLPIRTVLNPTKTTRRVRGVCQGALFGQQAFGGEFRGYEIHVGETVYDAGATRFAEIAREGIDGALPDGAVSEDGRVIGTYVHGFFDGDALRHTFVNAARAACGMAPAVEHAFVAREREGRLDRLAAHVRHSLDMELIRSWIGLRRP